MSSRFFIHRSGSAETEKYLAYFGNRAFYRPRLDLFGLPFWTNFYELGPIRRDLGALRRFRSAIAQADVKLVVTATDIESGEIAEFSNDDADRSDHPRSSHRQRQFAPELSGKDGWRALVSGTAACSTIRHWPRS